MPKQEPETARFGGQAFQHNSEANLRRNHHLSLPLFAFFHYCPILSVLQVICLWVSPKLVAPACSLIPVRDLETFITDSTISSFTIEINCSVGMGGCCCSSRKPQLLHGTPVYYYFPTVVLEDDELLSANSSPGRRRHPIELNLDMSTPDTYRTPPAPIPYDALFGCGQSSDSESFIETISCSSFETILSTPLDCNVETSSMIESPRKSKVEPLKSDGFNNLVTEEEDDVCPICLEEYIEEDPEILTKCNHHFHLECILEWMERSDVCPICNQETVLEVL